MPTFSQIFQKFADAGCVLYTNEEEYNQMKNPIASVFKIRQLVLTNFWYKGTGVNCKECMKKIISKKKQ
jgi:hypothetical protein